MLVFPSSDATTATTNARWTWSRFSFGVSTLLFLATAGAAGANETRADLVAALSLRGYPARVLRVISGQDMGGSGVPTIDKRC